MANSEVGTTGGLRRFWKIPFLAGWIGAALSMKTRTEQIVASASTSMDARSGRVVRLTQDHVYYIAQKEHLSLVWFAIGVAVFAVCYFVSSFATAGSRSLWRLLPVDDEYLSDDARRSAVVITSIGAAVCAACIAISYGVHWMG